MIVDMNILVPFSLGKVLFCAISKGIPCGEQIASQNGHLLALCVRSLGVHPGETSEVGSLSETGQQ